MYECLWEISVIIGDRAPAYSVTTWIQIAVGRAEGGKAGGIPGLEKGGVVGRGGGNIITTVSLHHIGEKEMHNISMFYNLFLFCHFPFGAFRGYFWG